MDKIGKDTNFRGLTIFNNVVYYTKGSGSNGVNTVYFVDTTGSDSKGNPMACPKGTGLPAASGSLPAAPIQYDPSVLQTKGVFPYNMCILNGFPTVLANAKPPLVPMFPFGVWFADADTLYVADEGNGTYADAATQTTAGLQKWMFDGSKWNLVYTLSNGLNLGQLYTVPGYPTGTNSATGLPWSPATDGRRNIIGRNNGDGHDLGHHLDGERQRRPGRRPQQAGRHYRHHRHDNIAHDRDVRHGAIGRFWRGPARRLVYAGDQRH